MKQRSFSKEIDLYIKHNIVASRDKSALLFMKKEYLETISSNSLFPDEKEIKLTELYERYKKITGINLGKVNMVELRSSYHHVPKVSKKDVSHDDLTTNINPDFSSKQEPSSVSNIIISDKTIEKQKDITVSDTISWDAENKTETLESLCTSDNHITDNVRETITDEPVVISSEEMKDIAQIKGFDVDTLIDAEMEDAFGKRKVAYSPGYVEGLVKKSIAVIATAGILFTTVYVLSMFIQ